MTGMKICFRTQVRERARPEALVGLRRSARKHKKASRLKMAWSGQNYI